MKPRVVCLILLLLLIIPIFSYFLVLSFMHLTEDQERAVLFLHQRIGSLDVFTSNEVSHMIDVQKIMFTVEVVFWAGLILFLMLWFDQSTFLRGKILFWAGISLVSFLLLILLGVVFWFDLVFAYFHYIFFPQGNWMFPADSLLIQTFPLSFFVKMSFWIFGLALLFGVVCMVIGYVLQKRSFSNNSLAQRAQLGNEN